MVMVGSGIGGAASSSNAGTTIVDLLKWNGWRETVVHNLKVVDGPFENDDPIICSCYNAAISGSGGFVVL